MNQLNWKPLSNEARNVLLVRWTISHTAAATSAATVEAVGRAEAREEEFKF